MIQEGAVVTIYYSDGPEKVPNVVGMTQQDAVKAIEAAGFKADVFESDDTTEPAGTVFRQSPEANQTPPAGTTITIFVSTFVEPTEPTTADRRRRMPTFPTSPVIPPPEG